MIALLVTGVSGGRWFQRLDPLFRSISWNALNQLTGVSKNTAGQASYSYDPLGRRVEKIAGATTTAWAYDREDILRQSATTGAVTTTTQFVHGPGIDEPMAQENATTSVVTYLQADGLGSIVRHTSTAGTIAETITYDSWGNIQAGTPGAYAFTGREWDAAAQMTFYRARWYDPRLGRFLSEDPAGRSQAVNLFAYVSNSPITFADPLGLYKLIGFPPDKEKQMSAAIIAAAKKVDQKPCCAGQADGPDLATTILMATYYYEPGMKEIGKTFGLFACGKVNIKNYFLGEIQIGSAAFDPAACCSLEHVVLHEGTHLASLSGKMGDVTGSSEKRAEACFPCQP